MVSQLRRMHEPRHPLHEMISSPDLERLMTTDEVAEYLKLKPRTIREMARQKILPAKRLGRQWRFSVVEIKQWFEQQAVESEPVSTGASW